MAKKVQLMTNPKQWQVVDGVEVLVDVPQEDIDPVVDSSCVEIEGHRTLEETISQENMFTPEIVETKVHSKVGGVYHDNVVDGAYEEAILYGNTQVNLVESVTTGTKYIPHSFTSFQGNESKIGNYNSGRTNQVAPLVKGVTMVNLCQETSVELTQGQSLCIDNIKGGTKYTISFIFTQKNSQAGIVIQSYNGETYLENSKLQSGLGDEVVMTFITHENANKIYINNGVGYGGETIQLDNIMVIEGDVTDLDLPFFKGMRSVELSRPLTNLFTDNTVMTSSSCTVTNTNGDITVTSDSIGSWKSANFCLQESLKPNTKYLVMWDSLVVTQTSTGATIINTYDLNNNTSLKASDSDIISPTLRSYVFDTGNVDVNNIVIRIHATTSNSETGTTTVTGLRVFEWDDSLRTLDLQTIGYFSGTKYVSARALETEGKNLYPYGDINFTPTSTGWFDAKGNGNMYGDIAQKSKCRFLLKKGTYKLSSDYYNRTNLGYMSLVTDKEEIIGDTTFTLDKDTYLTLRLQPVEANVATTLTNIQIERGETATTYEAYQGRYYKPRETEEIILRSLPNGVCDTFNLQTGELVQNIGEIVLDGSSDEVWYYLQSTQNGLGYFRVIIQDMSINNDQGQIPTYFVNDKYNIVHYNRLFLDENVPNSILISSTYSTSALAQTIFIYHNSIGDMTSFKTWLQENPVTVQYELKEPIITKLQTYDRIYNGQKNILTGMGNNLSALTYRYSTDYLKVANLSPIPAILEPITTIPYDVRLKPSTLYTIKYNRGGYSNSMSFDLGGSVVEKTNVTDLGIVPEEFTVKTPAILSHEQIRLSGTGYAHNFIVVEGDITGTELPYFEGMKDVKMPIVKNIGKNLFHGGFELGTINSSNGSYGDSTDGMRGLEYIRIIGGKTYVIACDDSTYRFAYVCYDKDKKFLRTSGGYYSGQTYKPQSDVEYVIMRTPNGEGMNNIHVKVALYEYEEGMDTTLQDYKENSVYAVQGEIPFSEDMFEQGGFNGTNKKGQSYDNCKVSANENIRIRTKDLIPVKPNTQYTISNQTSPNLNHVFYCFDGNRNYLEKQAEVNASSFTTTDDCYYVSLMLSKNNNANLSTTEFKQEQFRMYELDSTINLRSLPNGVKDELNLLTGEYIQRVGEVVFDGSDDEDWQLYNESIGGSKYFRIGMSVMKLHGDVYTLCTHAICDKLENVVYFSGIYNMSSRPDSVVAFVHSSTLNTQAMFVYQTGNQGDLAQFKQWLQQSPITVQYELAEPIISHVRLVSSNQEREVGVKLPNGVCNTYNPSTGITTIRVGKIVLDGSEDEEWGTAADNTGGAFRFETQLLSGKFNGTTNDTEVPILLCDKYATYKFYLIYKGDKVGISFYMSSHIVIYDNKYADLTSFKQALQSNPITVWYELKYPQIQPDIVLPNGVHDEYNPETGVYTKKVGFIEFDGSTDEIWVEPFGMSSDTPTIYSTWTSEPLPNAKRASMGDRIPGICNSLKFHNDFLGECNFEMYFISETGRFNLNIERAKLSSGTAAAFNQYLSQNPIKLWYELATPITYQLTPYFGLPQPYAYEDGYLIHDSAYAETTLPPEFKYKLVANRTGQVMQNNRKLQEHTTRLSNLEALIIEATIQSLFDRELQTFELELMDIQLIDLGE